MKYLIDTDVLIDNIRSKSKLDATVIEEGSAISIINLGELVYGSFKSINPPKALELVENLLRDFNLEIINLEKEIIYVFGKLKADLEQKGVKLDDFDLLLAATAKVNSLILVTRNQKHFQRIPGLEVA